MNRPGRDEDQGPVSEYKPRRRRPGTGDGPVSLADLFVPTLARMGHRTRARHLQLVGVWPRVVGEMVAEHTNPVTFYRGRLSVETDSPAMGHQLHLQRQEIMEALNRELGQDLVIDIRFRLAGEKP